jgi:hypothetical protein
MKESVSCGFVLFALQINPRALKGLINTAESKKALREALTHKGFSEKVKTLVCLFPDKFLFSDLLKFWATQTVIIVEQSATILAKMNILTDPGSQMQLLVDTLA